MKINKSIEPAIYVLCMLALQKDHTPIKSKVLSQVLQVSDSYLKKILHKMVKAGLISSNASKNGGFQLNRPIKEISLLDVFQALDLHKDVVGFQKLGSYIFIDDFAHEKEGEEKIVRAFQGALEVFYQELSTFSLDTLLREEFIDRGVIHWADRVRSEE